MRDALVNDALALGDISVEVAVVIGAAAAETGLTRWVRHAECWTDWRRAIAGVDAVLLLAPEMAGWLLRLSTLVVSLDTLLLGSSLDAVIIAGSKQRTAERLQAAGVAMVPTQSAGLPWPASSDGWVLKPDDGVGGMGCRLVPPGGPRPALSADARLVLQPFLPGLAGSLSLLVNEGVPLVLACNQQHLRWHSGDVELTGISVNAWPITLDAAEQLARAVVAAIPGLRGFCGVDFILAADGPVVVEVNPRVTSAYPLLRSSLGVNPLELLRARWHDARAVVPSLGRTLRQTDWPAG